MTKKKPGSGSPPSTQSRSTSPSRSSATVDLSAAGLGEESSSDPGVTESAVDSTSGDAATQRQIAYAIANPTAAGQLPLPSEVTTEITMPVVSPGDTRSWWQRVAPTCLGGKPDPEAQPLIPGETEQSFLRRHWKKLSALLLLLGGGAGVAVWQLLELFNKQDSDAPVTPFPFNSTTTVPFNTTTTTTRTTTTTTTTQAKPTFGIPYPDQFLYENYPAPLLGNAQVIIENAVSQFWLQLSGGLDTANTQASLESFDFTKTGAGEYTFTGNLSALSSSIRDALFDCAIINGNPANNATLFAQNSGGTASGLVNAYCYANEMLRRSVAEPSDAAAFSWTDPQCLLLLAVVAASAGYGAYRYVNSAPSADAAGTDPTTPSANSLSFWNNALRCTKEQIAAWVPGSPR